MLFLLMMLILMQVSFNQAKNLVFQCNKECGLDRVVQQQAEDIEFSQECSITTDQLIANNTLPSSPIAHFTDTKWYKHHNRDGKKALALNITWSKEITFLEKKTRRYYLQLIHRVQYPRLTISVGGKLDNLYQYDDIHTNYMCYGVKTRLIPSTWYMIYLKTIPIDRRETENLYDCSRIRIPSCRCPDIQDTVNCRGFKKRNLNWTKLTQKSACFNHAAADPSYSVLSSIYIAIIGCFFILIISTLLIWKCRRAGKDSQTVARKRVLFVTNISHGQDLVNSQAGRNISNIFSKYFHPDFVLWRLNEIRKSGAPAWVCDHIHEYDHVIVIVPAHEYGFPTEESNLNPQCDIYQAICNQIRTGCITNYSFISFYPTEKQMCGRNVIIIPENIGVLEKDFGIEMEGCKIENLKNNVRQLRSENLQSM
uniref:uncharacterized protein LOC100178362 isoform X2 n=1 Tax=Ciona intestinalis TaxID=7719 RepID=UPI000EF498FA|nr:uncharacterized protein LOC100178362 isoform X2 [Ciona intestinalis]|eukprot:XP_026695755.1 uncharacterized protein LOC100178362 isoform X2 [Ciona intestinalis]